MQSAAILAHSAGGCRGGMPRRQPQRDDLSRTYMHVRPQLLPQHRCLQAAALRRHRQCWHSTALVCMCCAVLAATASPAATATQPGSAARLWPLLSAGHSSVEVSEHVCGASSVQIHWPTEAERRATAADVLTVLAGEHLLDAKWEAQLRRSMVRLHPLPRPPAAWRALCRQAAAGSVSAPRRALAWRQYRVPDIEGAAGHRCHLTSLPACRRFAAPALNVWLAALFRALPSAMAAAGLQPVALSRYDLFHTHLFAAHDSNELGLLFHAREYPAQDNDTASPSCFPHNLGFCQRGTKLVFDGSAMDHRNILYFQGRAVVLDVGPGSALHTRLIMDGLQEVRTVQEGDFGRRLLDVNYFHALRDRRPQHRVFVCP